MMTHEELLKKIMTTDEYDALNDNDKKDIRSAIFSEHRTKISRENAYNYDYNSITFKDLSDKNNAAMKKYIFQNDITKKLTKTVKNASDYGIAGVLLRVGQKTTIAQNIFIVQQPEYINEVLVRAYLSVDYVDLGSYIEKDIEVMELQLDKISGKYSLTYKNVPWSEDNGSYVLENGQVQKVKDKTGETVDRTYEYTFDFSPLEILENNESAKGDWTYAATTLDLMAKFDSFISKEWSYIKTMLLNNLLAGSDKTADELQKQIESDKERIFDSADLDGLGGAPLSVFSQGGITSEIARVVKENYKEEVNDIIFSIGKLVGGNNKHTTEAIMSNIKGFNYLFAKKGFFLSFIQKLFYKIFKMNEAFDKDFALDKDWLELDCKFSKPIEIVLSSATQPQKNSIQKQGE